MRYDEHSKAVEAGVASTESKLNYLKACDERCAECCLLKNTDMLCDGIRPFVSIADSRHTQVLQLEFKVCHKRKALEINTLRDKMLSKSWIPEKALSEVRNYSSVPYSSVGVRRSKLGVENTKKSFVLVTSAIDMGFTARYVYMPALMAGYSNWVEALDEDLVEYPYLLVIDCIDLAVGPRIRRDAVIACIEQRAAIGKDTVVGISDEPISKDAREQEFYREVLAWPLLT